ncbi:myo-inositol catabolism protein IolB [Hyphomonas neptunium ATCC 15444]|uniref:Myo-inositol catabolism protein IolB n=2 Tax=Hyphomonas TaxID=85 RepID=Q0C062_HYPNA|nr:MULTISPECIES: 5-deoxy-glucuronate isomerase [Hyphomonas]ABI75777.1 myo-inositol catabolism protein IolB [Hyphomonas neptunium ATCC 15444]KCZ90536.1 myo-inositol catabolism protein IolB [Hyphomonas hirschiana VP5]
MPDLRVKSGTPASDGCVLSITPESAGWDHVGFAVHRLEEGKGFESAASSRETCLVILTGTARVSVGTEVFAHLGERKTVFEGPPAAVYIPAGERYSVTAEMPLEVAVCSAPGGGNHPARVIAPGSIEKEIRGKAANTRYVQDILSDRDPAHSLLVVEVITPGGNWSSYPPHKHDTDTLPEESALEETYYHRLNPPQGFAVQRVYTDDRSLDETVSVEDGDCVMVPAGYHPVGAPYGYDLYYLNVMAGAKRKWVFRNDPAHEWIIKK